MWFDDDPSRELTQKEIEERKHDVAWDLFFAFRWLFAIFVVIPFAIYFFTR